MIETTSTKTPCAIPKLSKYNIISKIHMKNILTLLSVVAAATALHADPISQNNTEANKKVPALPPSSESAPVNTNTRELKITGKYLLVPVSNHLKKGEGRRMRITVGDRLVHNIDCDFPTNKDAIDWWTYLDMSDYLGKTAKITADVAPEIRELIESSDQIRNLQPLYNEALRPQFHFSQMRGWNNDPNGMCYYDGKYHLFWQSNPAGRNWGNMYWGHATSQDMVHWTEHDRALRSFGEDVKDRQPNMAVKNCFSGSGNVDENNTAGWQKGDQKTMVVAFTDTGCGECIVYSTDRGNKWTYYEGNPVIKHKGRDPKLMWYAPGNHWVIALFDQTGEQGIAFYTSKNLKDWEFASKINGYFECAEIFQLPVEGDPNQTKWVIFAADAEYAIGQFDGKTFTPEEKGKHRVHWGAYYASQCFSRPPDGRVVQIGWARIETPDMPFNQTFSVPTSLTLHNTEDGIRMFADPIKELAQLHKANPKTVGNKELTDKAPEVHFDAEDQLFDIVVTLKQGRAAKAILRFGADEVIYDFNSQKLDEMPLKLKDGAVTFRVLVDRPMYEVVGGGGACFKTSARKEMGKPLGTISLTAEGGSLTVDSLKAYEMKSAWKDR